MKSMFLFWKTSRCSPRGRGEEAIVHPVQLWSEYRLSNSITARLTRSIVVATLLFFRRMSSCSIFWATRCSPVRGDHARHIDWWLDNLSLAALLWLAAFVVDMLWLNRVFIQWFSRGKSDWPQEMLQRPQRLQRLHADNLRDFIDLEMVADWTRDIGRLTFFPFYVLALLIFARMNRFDAWSWPSALIIVYAIVLLLVILGAARVRGARRNLCAARPWPRCGSATHVLVDDSAAARLLQGDQRPQSRRLRALLRTTGHEGALLAARRSWCRRSLAGACAVVVTGVTGRVWHVVDLHELRHLWNPALLHEGGVIGMIAVEGIGRRVIKLHRETEGERVLGARLAQALKLLHAWIFASSQAARRKSRSAAEPGACLRRKTTVWRIMAVSLRAQKSQRCAFPFVGRDFDEVDLRSRADKRAACRAVLCPSVRPSTPASRPV
jgi:hypothetical protein